MNDFNGARRTTVDWKCFECRVRDSGYQTSSFITGNVTPLRPVVTVARQSVSSSLQIANRSFGIHHLTSGISSPFHSVNLILFTIRLSSWFTRAYHLITVTTFENNL